MFNIDKHFAKGFCGIFLLFLTLMSYSGDTGKVEIEYFFQPGCKECDYINAFIIPDLNERYGEKILLLKYDINIKANFLRLADLQDKFNVNSNEPVSMFVNGKYALCGLEAISKNLNESIDEAIQTDAVLPSGTVENRDPEKIILDRGQKMKLAAIISAGFLDGINPCVFSTLIFFISLLSVMKTSLRKIIIIGSVYCFSCFISYFLLGFGLFKIIRTFSHFNTLQNLLELLMGLILLALAGISFLDAWKYSKDKNASRVILQLPDNFKLKIHEIMKKGLNYKFIIPGSFSIGIFVTIIESVCTGQLYLPTLVFLAREGDVALKWLALLFLYNIMYIIPLVTIFIMFICGIKIKSFLNISKRYIFPIKIATGIFFVFLAILLFAY